MTKIEELGRKKGYKTHYHTVYGVYNGKLEDINFEVLILEEQKRVEVEVDMEDWERIPNREYLQDIIDAFDYAEKIGNEILKEL